MNKKCIGLSQRIDSDRITPIYRVESHRDASRYVKQDVNMPGA